MREFVNLIKELLLIKEEKVSLVGLTGFKRAQRQVIKKAKKPSNKDMKLSDLMRKSY